MRKLVTILLVAELIAAFFVLAPACILRHEQVRAFAAWRHNPTPETTAEWNRQKRITGLETLGFSAVVFGIMAGVTLFSARLWKQKHPTEAFTK